MRLAPPTREPRSATAAYIRDLLRIWRVAQDVIAHGLNPLLDIWDFPLVDSTGCSCCSSRRPRPRHCWGAGGRFDAGHPPNEYNPLAPQPRRRPIASLTDNELRRLWPTIEPEDIRRHAPWATSRDEVIRVAYPGRGLPASDQAVEAYVRDAIEVARKSPFAAQSLEGTRPASPPGPGAFRIRPPYQPPVILGSNGLPIPPPPVPVVLSAEAVTRQLEWVNLATHELVTTGNVEQMVLVNGERVDRWATRENRRVLAIDPRRDPGQALQLRQWGQINANLIESGIRAPWDGVRLRPLLSDVEGVVRNAHAQGLRVEVLAHQLRERFDVSDSRAALIARDQVLKLNGQLNRSKQQSAGITQYVWVTSRDERVRPTHEDLDGTTQSWDVPPPEGHPGQPVQCRCTARAIIPEFEVGG